MKEWKVNFIYKIVIFILFLIAPVILIGVEEKTDLYVKKFIYIYILELAVLLCSYLMYEVRLKGYYNKLVKKTVKVNEKFNLKNNNYKRFMGLDSFSSFEYFFNEELDKLYNELEKYRESYNNMEVNKKKEAEYKDNKLEKVEEALSESIQERRFAIEFLERATGFLTNFKRGDVKYTNIFEELTFYMKNFFKVSELYIIQKDKSGYKYYTNLSNESKRITEDVLKRLEALDSKLYKSDKLNFELNYDLIAPLKTDDKIHGIIFLNLEEDISLENENLFAVMNKVFEIFNSILDLYYQLHRKDLSINKLNDDIQRLKSDLRETDENLDIHLEQMSNMYEEIVTLYEVGKKIGKIYDKKDIEEAILTTLQEITETEYALIYYYEDEKLKVSKRINFEGVEFLQIDKVESLLEKLFADMKKAEKAIIVNELAKLENYEQLPDLVKENVRNFVEAPIIIGQEIKGGVILFNKEEEFTAANVNLITSLINQMSISVQNIEYFQKEIERQKEEEQLKIASKIQSGLFPQEMPELKDASFFGMNIPAKAVGGDYYDLVQVDQDRVIGFVADVSGKGIPASLLVSIVRTIFRMIVEEFKEYSPEKILTRLNNVLLKENLEGRFVTAVCFTIDSSKGIIETSSAGHDPFLFYRPSTDELKKYPSDSIVLGIMEDIYEKEVIEYQEGDIFLFYTDGVAEARKDNGEFYTLERVEEAVKKYAEKSAKELIDTMYSELKDFVQEAKQNDDITLLAIKGGHSEGA